MTAALSLQSWRYSPLMPLARINWPQRAISCARPRANSSGVPGEADTPTWASLLRTSASLSAALRAALSFVITAGGGGERRGQDAGPLVGDGVGEALLHES